MAPLGEFELLVLMAVLHLGDAAQPPAVLRAIEDRTARAVSRGAVYVTLERLEAKRLLTSRVADEAPGQGGRPRRAYRVSPLGVRAVRRMLSALERMRTGLEPLLAES